MQKLLRPICLFLLLFPIFWEVGHRGSCCDLCRRVATQNFKRNLLILYTSVQSLSRVHSLRPHGWQHARPPCPSPTPGACSNSCPLSWWCHPTISSSVVPLSSCLQSFPASGSFPMSQFFTSGDQSIGVSASVSVFPMNVQDWFLFFFFSFIFISWRLITLWYCTDFFYDGLVGSLYSPKDSQESSPTP